MNDIRTALDQIRRSIVPDPERAAFEHLRRRKDRRSIQRRAAAAVTAVVIAIASTAVVIRAFDQPDSVAVNPSPLPAVVPHEMVTIPVGPTGQVGAIISGFGGVWVAAYGVPGGKGIDRDAILRVDPATNEVVDTIPVDTVPTWETGGGGLATGFGSLWVAGWAKIDGRDEGLLLRVDPDSLAVAAEIPLPAFDGATDVAVNDTGVWVVGRTSEASGIAKIDPGTNQVIGQAVLRAQTARRVVATNDAVIVEELEWTGNQGPCSILASVDPTDARLLAEQPRQDSCSGGGDPFAWDGNVWVAGGEGFAEVDPATATAIPPVTSYAGEDGFPRGDVAVGASGVWFGAYPGGNGDAPDTLSRFDPAAGRIDIYPLKVGWSAATVLDGTIWAMNFDGTVTRVDLSPVSDAVSSTSAPPPSAESLDHPIIATLDYRLARVARSTNTPTWLTGTATSLRSPYPVRDVAISSDGALVAFVGFSSIEGTSYIYTGPSNGSRWTPLLSTAGGEHPSWSPDGTRLTFFAGSKIYIVNADGTGLEPIASGILPTWSPDGRTIAYARLGGGISLFDVASQTSTELTRGDDAWPAFSPDGSDLAFVRTDKSGPNVLVVPPSGGDPVPLSDCAPGQCGKPISLVWDPSGSSVAFVVDGDIVEMSTSGDEIARVSFSDAFGSSLGNFVWISGSS